MLLATASAFFDSMIWAVCLFSTMSTGYKTAVRFSLHLRTHSISTGSRTVCLRPNRWLANLPTMYSPFSLSLASFLLPSPCPGTWKVCSFIILDYRYHLTFHRSVEHGHLPLYGL